MGFIQMGIELQDNFSSPLMNIANTVYYVTDSIANFQNAINSNLDTSSFADVRSEVDATLSAIDELQTSMQNTVLPTISADIQPQIETPDSVTIPVTAVVEQPTIEVPETVEVPIQPVVMEQPQVDIQLQLQQIEQLQSLLQNVSSIQQRISQQSKAVAVLPKETKNEIQNVNASIEQMNEELNMIQENPFHLPIETVQLQIVELKNHLQEAAQEQQQISEALSHMDIEIEQPPPISWQVEPLEVFTDSGFDRFRQETASANTMLEQLSNTQNEIARQAYNTDLLPPEAFQSLNNLAVRIDMVRERIIEIENNPLNIGTDTANVELERLRHQLNQAVQEQSELTQAMQNMDISAINTAYLNLSQTIGSTERYIRDNIDEQGRFNQEISNGISQADGLMNAIKGVVGAYVGVQTIGDILSVSDELTQTTSRLNMMNDGLQSTEELTNMIYAAAQDSRGSFSEMADLVARFGNNAGDAFGSSAEIVAFADLLQKQMTIAGTSTQEASAAMLQLSQALGSGVLRGDELNSIFEQAPNLIQNIAGYIQNNEDVARKMADAIGVSYEEMSTNAMGHIRDLATQGQLSADLVKTAVFSASEEINAQFAQMPVTWEQIWQSIQDTALIAFRPVLQRINDIGNSEAFQNFVNGAINALAVLASVVLDVFDFAASCGQFVADNWSVISPVIYGVISALAVYGAYLAITKGMEMASAAAKGVLAVAEGIHAAALILTADMTWSAATAQLGLNGAMYECPVVWITILIISLIAALVSLCNWIAQTTGAAASGIGIVTGLLSVAVAVILNLIFAVINTVINIVVELYNFIAAFANFLGNVFDNKVMAIMNLFMDLFDFIVGVMESAASVIDMVLGSDISGALSGFRDNVSAAVNEITDAMGGEKVVMEVLDASDYRIERIDYSEAFGKGALWGDNLAEKIGDFDLSALNSQIDIPDPQDYTSQFAGISDSLDGISGDTSGIYDAMDITQEDLKYMRDLAEQEVVNRYTTAEITIEQTNNNTVSGTMDLDGIMTGLTDMVNEAAEIIVGKGD